MTAQVKDGPAIERLEWIAPNKLNVSFRVMTYYDIGTDALAVRLDAMLGVPIPQPGAPFPQRGTQFSAAFVVSEQSSLFTPSAGIKDCINLRMRGCDLVSVLRGLADKVEADLKWREINK